MPDLARLADDLKRCRDETGQKCAGDAQKILGADERSLRAL